jgi:hypothetical protein
MTAFELAWRTAKRYRARAVLAIVGVAVIGALNFDMLLLARGLLLSFTDLINNTGYNVRIVGSAGLPLARLPVEDAGKLVDQIRGLPQVASVAMMRTEPASTAPPSGPPVGLELIGTTDFDGEGVWKGPGSSSALRSLPSSFRKGSHRVSCSMSVRRFGSACG